MRRYDDAYAYQNTFGPLIKMEADYDRQVRPSARPGRILGLGSRVWGGVAPQLSYRPDEHAGEPAHACKGGPGCAVHAGLHQHAS